MAQPPTPVEQALEREDAIALANAASTQELERLKLAEQVVELVHHRRKRSERSVITAQALVGYVALAGLVVNAYQSYSNNQKQVSQQQSDKERWNKEFERSQQADKYRAFFETSMLATDPANADKRPARAY